MISTSARLREIYAQALFELAGQQQSIDMVKNDLDLLSGIIGQEKDFIKVLDSPYFSTDYKEQLVRRLFSGAVTDLTIVFLSAVVRHGRAKLLNDVVGRYGELWDEHHGYHHVEVTVSKDLDDGEVRRLSDDIAAAIGSKVKLEVAVEPDLIGGAVIRWGGKVIDNSVKNRLYRGVKTVISRVKSRE